MLEDDLKASYDWADAPTRVAVIRDVLIPKTFRELAQAFVALHHDTRGPIEVDSDSLGVLTDQRGKCLEEMRGYFHHRSSWHTLLVLHWSLETAAEAAESEPGRSAMPHAPDELIAHAAELFRHDLHRGGMEPNS